MRNVLIAIGLLLAVAVAAWFGYDRFVGTRPTEPVSTPVSTVTSTQAPDSTEAAIALMTKVYAEFAPTGQARSAREIGATSVELTRLMTAAEAAPEPVIGFAPEVDSQDFEISQLTIRPLAPVEAGKLVMVAEFRNYGEAKAVHYDLILENGAWAIDNIRTEGETGWNLRTLMAEGGIR